MLGGLHRHGAQGDQEIEIILQGNEDDQEGLDQADKNDSGEDQNSTHKRKKRILKFNESQGEKTLDKPENLNVVQFDTELMIDPLFKLTTQKFDEMSLGALMTSRLNINSELLIQFDSQMPQNLFQQEEYLNQNHNKNNSPSYCGMLSNVISKNFNAQIVTSDKTGAMSRNLDSYIIMQDHFINKIIKGDTDDNQEYRQYQQQQDYTSNRNSIGPMDQVHQHSGNIQDYNVDGFQGFDQANDEMNEMPRSPEKDKSIIELADNDYNLDTNPNQDSVYFVSQKSIFPSGSNRDELLNCSQVSVDYMQRLPDSLDSSRDNGASDDEEKLNMFMSCDLENLFQSTKGSMISSSKNSSKSKLQQSQMSQKNSQVPAQQMKIGDGNSLKNQLALLTTRDITQLDIKKVQAFTEVNKENIDPQIHIDFQNKNQKNLKILKKDQIEQQKVSILNGLNLNNDFSVSKFGKQLTQQRKIRQGKKLRRFKHLTWDNIIEEKERHIVPLNLNIGFQRLTQLFGRSLYIKYFIKNMDKDKIKEYLSHGNRMDGMNQNMDQEMNGQEIGYDDLNNQQVELGFEDAQLADGFAANMYQGFDQKPKNIFHDVSDGGLITRFGMQGSNQERDEIKVDLFRIQKKIDVKKLKQQLWDYIDPVADQMNAIKKHVVTYEQNVKKSKRQKNNPNYEDDDEIDGLKLSQVMSNLYGSRQVDAENVSIHSAFICLLHIANEKGNIVKQLIYFIGLILEPEEEIDLEIFKAIRV
ncbi:UNKNOWN [Stylonychia lemnae]|uniref:Condensin complex subunit 2 n=1 Tax=Stylonychia lemnae TaxID=5949 RepID=A0A078ANY9_STYLE|nr:UNKNOWN [Stylonychia lemnae]|eukprot:CDW83022.1 UNKNOWN [Stylonychia lemnae]